MYEYKAHLVRVIDGDTIEVDVDLGFHVQCRQTLRLDGVDTPELHGPEHDAAVDAQGAMIRWLGGPGSDITIRTRTDIRGDDRADSFGRRYLAIVMRLGINLNEALVDGGYAKRWVRT